jgi:hypothetical protein
VLHRPAGLSPESNKYEVLVRTENEREKST